MSSRLVQESSLQFFTNLISGHDPVLIGCHHGWCKTSKCDWDDQQRAEIDKFLILCPATSVTRLGYF